MKKFFSVLLALLLVFGATTAMATSVEELGRALTKEELESIRPANFGNKAISYIAPYSAGGAADLVGRKLAARVLSTWVEDFVLSADPAPWVS